MIKELLCSLLEDCNERLLVFRNNCLCLVSHLFLTIGCSDFVDIFDKPEFCLLLINPCHWSPRNEKNKSKHPSPKVPGGLGLYHGRAWAACPASGSLELVVCLTSLSLVMICRMGVLIILWRFIGLMYMHEEHCVFPGNSYSVIFLTVA